MSSTKRKMKKKMAGKLSFGILFALALLALMLVFGVVSGWAGPQKRGKQAKERVPDTLILVSTFAETGQTLRGVRVRLFPANAEGKIIKGKALDGQTNNMGEFPFLVPHKEATYVLRAEVKGFARTEKSVKVQGEEKIDVFLQMPAAR